MDEDEKEDPTWISNISPRKIRSLWNISSSYRNFHLETLSSYISILSHIPRVMIHTPGREKVVETPRELPKSDENSP